MKEIQIQKATIVFDPRKTYPGILTCKVCKSEIAVENINSFDVDCDCGATIASPQAELKEILIK